MEQQNYVAPSTIFAFNFSNLETAGYTTDATSQQILDPASSNGYASFLLGDVDNASLKDTGTAPAFYGRYHSFAIYGQDDFKLTPKLTLNLGLRWNVAMPVSEKFNHMSWLNPDLPNPAAGGFHGALQFAGSGADSCNCSSRVQTHWLAFDPRIGMAYSLNEKTVLRGSFSIVHFQGAALGGSDQVFGSGQTGYQATPSFSTPDGGRSAAFNWQSGFPAYQKPPFFDPTLQTGFNTASPNNAGGLSFDRPTTAGIQPYSENWNLTISRALASSVVWEISYTGSQTHHILQNGGSGIYSDALNPKYFALPDSILFAPATPANLAKAAAIVPGVALPYPTFIGNIAQALRPFPQYSGIGDSYANFGQASYNALQTSVQKRMSDGLYLMASYVWSKTIDTNASTIPWLNGGARDAYNLRAERAVSSADFPNAIKLLWVYTLPIGRGHKLNVSNAVLNSVVGGWQVAGDNVYVDGNPIGPIFGTCDTPYDGYCYADFNPSFTGKVRQNGRPGVGLSVATTSYINAAAFQDATTTNLRGRGNTPRTLAFNLRNPWALNEDLSVSKIFPIRERLDFKFKFDAFNLFNRSVFSGYDTGIHDANFGHVNGQSNQPRQLQFEGYLRF